MSTTAILALLAKVANGARRLPEWAWGVIVFALMAGSGWWLHTRSVELAVLADRQVRAREAQVVLDSIVGFERAKARWAVEEAQKATRASWATRDRAVAQTKAAERAVTVAQSRVRETIAAIPDSLKQLPVIKSALQACTALANDCEQLRAEIVTERAATDTAKAVVDRERRAHLLQQALADTALAKAGVVIVDQRSAIAKLGGRIPRKVAVVGGALAAIAGWTARELVYRRHP
jgi:hypothetical protein